MLTHPKLHPLSACVGEIRDLFLDDHVHMALLVDEGRLITAIERADLPEAIDDEVPARLTGQISGRTISPQATLPEAFAAMRDAGRRRLAAVDRNGIAVGLLCLKANGLGFCSDDDVERRSSEGLRGDPPAKRLGSPSGRLPLMSPPERPGPVAQPAFKAGQAV